MLLENSPKYSCNTASETREWINAIINFIKPYKFFLHAHVTNFFKDRIWEDVDEDWMNCLRNESVESLLLIPCGVVQDHWPESLREFILTSRHISLPRDPADLQKVFSGFRMTELDKVLAQGMNAKKKHEIEALAGVVSAVAHRVEADTVVDVGAGQGYLSQVLSFQYQYSVYAIDASSHHGRVTDARAERIRKHYNAKIRKSRFGKKDLQMPQTVTCRVLSTSMLKNLSNSILKKDHNSLNHITGSIVGEPQTASCSASYSSCNSTLVLAGLHACGDLSVTMLRTFMECEEVKAVVSVGCCYNLLSEEDLEGVDHHSGFPLSRDLKSSKFRLGKKARDLACQSAERWGSMGKAEGISNFELHAFRAVFQMVLCQYYPETLTSSPALGRQGKAHRRQRQWKLVASSVNAEECANFSTFDNKGSKLSIDCSGSDTAEGSAVHNISEAKDINPNQDNSFSMFKQFSQSGLCRLGLSQLQDVELQMIWEKIEPFMELVGPYWSLRAALGPVLETLLLLDRLLYLQEQGDSLEVTMIPIFDPILSPRNVAIIARKVLG